MFGQHDLQPKRSLNWSVAHSTKDENVSMYKIVRRNGCISFLMKSMPIVSRDERPPKIVYESQGSTRSRNVLLNLRQIGFQLLR